MNYVTLTAEERARMEATHQPGATIVKRLGAGRTPVCMGCGMDWPCPGRRLLDAVRSPTAKDTARLDWLEACDHAINPSLRVERYSMFYGPTLRDDIDSATGFVFDFQEPTKAVVSSRALTSGIAYGLLSWAAAAIVVFLGYVLGRRLGAW